MCSWAVGSLLLFAGRAPEAASELRAAIAGMERIGITRTALLVRTDLATVLAFAGDEAGAFEALSPALNPPTLVFDLEGKALQALGWIHACGGRFDDAASSFVRAADAYGAPGHDLGSLIALVDAARVGAARAVLPRIEALAVGVEGVFAEVSVRHARALALAESLGTDDEADAAQLATEFDQIGQVAAGIDLHMLAAEAFARAATLHRSSGTARSAAASARRRDEQLTECGLENLPLVVELTTSPLSERELEIANLAADGMTNRQIADQLVLSVRTVETHLQRVYQKLGVRGRSEVGAAL
jgi:DNA-binding NarL/FixJ family response regulator